MPRASRLRFTQAELARAIRAADAAGKVALQTPLGILFLDPGVVPQTVASEPESEANTCDAVWGAR